MSSYARSLRVTVSLASSAKIGSIAETIILIIMLTTIYRTLQLHMSTAMDSDSDSGSSGEAKLHLIGWLGLPSCFTACAGNHRGSPIGLPRNSPEYTRYKEDAIIFYLLQRLLKEFILTSRPTGAANSRVQNGPRCVCIRPYSTGDWNLEISTIWQESVDKD
jgi:hypothetical protein